MFFLPMHWLLGIQVRDPKQFPMDAGFMVSPYTAYLVRTSWNDGTHVMVRRRYTDFVAGMSLLRCKSRRPLSHTQMQRSARLDRETLHRFSAALSTREKVEQR